MDSEHNVRISKRSGVLGSIFDAELGIKEYSGNYSPRTCFCCDLIDPEN